MLISVCFKKLCTAGLLFKKVYKLTDFEQLADGFGEKPFQ